MIQGVHGRLGGLPLQEVSKSQRVVAFLWFWSCLGWCRSGTHHAYDPKQVRRMSSHTHCLVVPSMYRDSIVLMQLASALEQLPGVQRVAVMLGTPSNKALLQEAGLLTCEGETATANDVLICVQAHTPEAIAQVLEEARERCTAPPAGTPFLQVMAPRTLESALRRLPTANLACISVPGAYAAYEAWKALQHGLHVFLFSHHVALDTEAQLKQFAARRGLLVMGPDCGTAFVHGVPLGFANQAGRGPVGIIAASGTGLQQVVCLLAQQGIGISQAIGVGGRDLHRRIGGQSMRAALQALTRDAETRVIVLLSKPPDATVASWIVQDAARSGKPCVIAFLGAAPSFKTTPMITQVHTLHDAARKAAVYVLPDETRSMPEVVSSLSDAVLTEARAKLRPEQWAVRGLYCGGTLAYEALWLLREALGTVQSNLDGTWPAGGAPGHGVLDLGTEELTRGRPHPMIDPTIRRQWLLEMARQAEVAVVLCDVILGWGAHADPATALGTAWHDAQTLARAEGRALVGIATVCGTPHDPQGYARQCQILHDSGLLVADSNVQAVRLAAAIARPQPENRQALRVSAAFQMPLVTALPHAPPPAAPLHLAEVFANGPRVINLGLESFTAPLRAAGIPVVQVDWRPPARGDVHMIRVLERLQALDRALA